VARFCDPGCKCDLHKRSARTKKAISNSWTPERRTTAAERTKQVKPWLYRGPKDEVQRPQRHARVTKARGKVTDYECVVCQKRNAETWARINGADPYDIYGYQPMCRRCHYWYDVELHPHVNGRWIKKEVVPDEETPLCVSSSFSATQRSHLGTGISYQKSMLSEQPN
jgi:hypothetical protein